MKEYKLTFKTSLLVLDENIQEKENKIKNNTEVNNSEFHSTSNTTSNRTVFRRKQTDDDDELVLDIKFQNTTVISDMDLVIRNFKDKELNITHRVEPDDEICYLKVNVPVVNISNSKYSCNNLQSEDEKRIAIRNYFNLSKENGEMKTNVRAKTLRKDENIRTSNPKERKFKHTSEISFTQLTMNEMLLSNPTLNHTSNTTNTTSIRIKMTHPEEDDVDIFTYYLKQLQNISVHSSNLEEVCSKCLNNIDYLNNLFTEVRAIKKDLKDFTNKTNSKQETIIKFSDYINSINLIKVELYHANFSLQIVKNAGCTRTYESNNEKFQATLKRANLLIEAIQDSIRKQNLNVNFIVIS